MSHTPFAWEARRLKPNDILHIVGCSPPVVYYYFLVESSVVEAEAESRRATEAGPCLIVCPFPPHSELISHTTFPLKGKRKNGPDERKQLSGKPAQGCQQLGEKCLLPLVNRVAISNLGNSWRYQGCACGRSSVGTRCHSVRHPLQLPFPPGQVILVV